MTNNLALPDVLTAAIDVKAAELAHFQIGGVGVGFMDAQRRLKRWCENFRGLIADLSILREIIAGLRLVDDQAVMVSARGLMNLLYPGENIFYTPFGGDNESSARIMRTLNAEPNYGPDIGVCLDKILLAGEEQPVILLVDDFLNSGGQFTRIIRNDWLAPSGVLSPEQRSCLARCELAFYFAFGTAEGRIRAQSILADAGLRGEVQYREQYCGAVGCFGTADDISRISLVGNGGGSGLFSGYSAAGTAELIRVCREAGAQTLRQAKPEWKDEKVNERALGYGQGAKLLLAQNNVPTFTLTCLWSSGDVSIGGKKFRWNALFDRRNKQTTVREEVPSLLSSQHRRSLSPFPLWQDRSGYELTPNLIRGDAPMLFASILGKQVLATLNPLLAMMEQGNEFARIVLMSTKDTLKQAEKIRLTLAERGVLPLDQVSISPVSSTLEQEGNIPSVLDVLTTLQTEAGHLVFNIAGGMNFMVSACAAVLDPKRSTMLYPDKRYVYQVSLGQQPPRVTCLPLPSPLALFEMFELQGITCTPAPGGVPQRLRELLRNHKASLPAGGVISGAIGGISFDAIWNDGNTLKFLLCMQTYDKDELRRLIAFSNDRTALFDLLHREIGVISGNDQVIERLSSEARHISLIRLSAMGGIELKGFLDRKGIKSIPAVPKTIPTGRTPGNGNVLLTPLGEDPAATITALYSHRPGRAILCYTPDNKDVVRCVRSLESKLDLLPPGLAEITFFPVSIAGDEILGIDAPHDSTELVVNITPGLKSHAFFLSIWGTLRGAKVYSLENQKRILSRLNGPTDHPALGLDVPRPRDFLAIRGENLRLPAYKGDIISDVGLRLLFELLLNEQPGPPPPGFPGKPLEHAPVSSRYLHREGQVELRRGREQGRVPARDGAWFELLVGHALSRAGAIKIDTQITARWGKAIEERIEARKKLGSEVHRTEIDVACVVKGRYVVVSCKAWDPESYERKNAEGIAQLTREVRAMAALFGRFALPMLAFYGYNGEPYLVDGVVLFGFQTYMSPKNLKALIDDEFSRRSTVK